MTTQVHPAIEPAVSWLDLGNRLDTTVAWLAAAARSLFAVLDQPRRSAPLYLINFADLIADANAALRPLHAWLGRPHRRLARQAARGLPSVQSGRIELPTEIEYDRHDLRRRCSTDRLAEIQAAVFSAVPDVMRLIAVRSGPVDRPAAALQGAA